LKKLNNHLEAIFCSERCYIRKFYPEDIEKFISYRNNFQWMQYQGYKGFDRERYEKDLLKEGPLTDGRQLAIISKERDCLIGDIFISKDEDSFWIGYTIDPHYKRQGYTYEVVNAMISWIKWQGDYKIMAGVDPKNIPSINLLEKIGFSKVMKKDNEIIYTLKK